MPAHQNYPPGQGPLDFIGQVLTDYARELERQGHGVAARSLSAQCNIAVAEVKRQIEGSLRPRPSEPADADAEG